MQRKYPNLTSRGSNASQEARFDMMSDEPPPLPPRPPETLRPPEEPLLSEESEVNSEEGSPPPSPVTPPPPPPTSAPPGKIRDLVSLSLSFVSPSLSLSLGPPISPFEQEDDTANIKMESNLAHINTLQELNSEDEREGDREEFGFAVNSGSSDHPSGSTEEEVAGNGPVTILEESCSEGEEKGEEKPPPPVPPRSHSLSPSPVMAGLNSYGGGGGGVTDIYEDNLKTATGSFLSEGRGGERATPPLPRLVNGIANGEPEPGSAPPPLPSKVGRRRSNEPRLQEIAEEERMLMNELDLLEKIVDSKEPGKDGEERSAPSPEHPGKSPPAEPSSRDLQANGPPPESPVSEKAAIRA